MKVSALLVLVFGSANVFANDSHLRGNRELTAENTVPGLFNLKEDSEGHWILVKEEDNEE